MIEKISATLRGILDSPLAHRKKGAYIHQKPDLSMDPLVDNLALNQVQQLLPQVMTLARRRSCASEQIGQTIFAREDNIASLLTNWYLLDGWKKTDLPEIMRSDLECVLSPDPHPTSTLQQRVLLSNVGSQTIDAYEYGQINPFQFHVSTHKVSFADTLAPSMDFSARVQTIISFDGEPKGHKHQIRYFKALLSAYALADILESQDMSNDQNKILLKDRKSFATSWVTFAQRVRTLGINPHTLTPDANLLYSLGKVHESAYLFETYDYVFHNQKHIAFR